MRKSIIFISPCSLGMMDNCAIKYATRLGYDTAVAVDNNYSSSCETDYIIFTDTSNANTLIADLEVFNKEHPIAGIVTYSDYHVEVTALANEYFHLSGPSYSSIIRCKNKLLCRMTLEANGLRQPKCVLIKDSDDFKKAIKNVGIPCVIKPMNGLGSTYTRVITDMEEAYEQFLNLQRERKSEALGIGDNWVLEECLEGFQISVESYTYHGETKVVCIHDKMNPIEPPLFRVFYSATPSPRISENTANDIINKTKRALELIGFDNGVSHTEYRISKSGDVQLLEINARTGGGLIIPSAYYSTNINLYTVAIDLALGKKPTTAEYSGKSYPVVFKVLYPEKEGKIEALNGLSELKSSQKFEIVEQNAKEGDVVGLGQRLGLVLKRGKENQSVEELVEYIDYYINQVKVEIQSIEEKIPLPSHLNNSAH